MKIWRIRKVQESRSSVKPCETMVKPKGLWFSQPATRSGTFPKEASQRIWMVIPIQKAGIQKSCWRGFLLPLGLEDQEDVQVEWIKNNKNTLPIGSMYAIYGCIYHQYTPNVSIYTIHRSYGLYLLHIGTVTKAFADICSLDELASSRMSSHFVCIRIFHVFSFQGARHLPKRIFAPRAGD